MDRKKHWNESVFKTIADGFDQYLKDTKATRGDKGDMISVACLMFLALPAERQRFISILYSARAKRSESVLDAAMNLLEEQAEADRKRDSPPERPDKRRSAG